MRNNIKNLIDKNKFLGQFNTEEEAHQARLKAEQKYFGEYAPQEV